MEHPKQTPIYRPNYHDSLSPRSMWKEEVKENKVQVQLPDPAPKVPRVPSATEAQYAMEAREGYKELTDDEKNLLAATVVCSNAWRKFLKPELEMRANPVRRQVNSDSDYYRVLNENAIAAFINEFVSTLESRAKRSPSYSFTFDQEEPS